MNSFRKICVVGLGYIGLPTAAMFASRKIKVVGVGVDVDPVTVEAINSGQIHMVEPDLDMLIGAAVTSGYLSARSEPEPADAYLIAVPTPCSSTMEPDLSYLEAAANSIAPCLHKGALVVLESTSPPGTTEFLSGLLGDLRPDLSFPHQADTRADIFVAHCPERVLPGHIVRELISNDRVIGGISASCAECARDLYRLIVEGECLLTSARTAEMAKLAENSFRDVNIAFANELSMICDGLDIDVWELISLANRHPRVSILQPGPGVGGHCIAVDPWFIIASSPETSRLIRMARDVNDSKPHHVVNQVRLTMSELGVASPKLACLGLAFKANVDDLRESPALAIVEELAGEEQWGILAVEPYIECLPATLLACRNVQLTSLSEAITKADVILLLVNHQQFDSVRDADLSDKIVIDTKGMLKV